MKQFFLCLIFLTFNSCFAGTVVFLHGTVCAGKTSLCKELLKRDDWVLISEDDIFYKEVVLRWQREFSDEFKEVNRVVDKENILHAVMRNQVLFCANASEWEREKARLAISRIQEELNEKKNQEENDPESWGNLLRTKIAALIKKFAATKNVIVETWFLKKEQIDEIEAQYKVMHVGVYCSFLQIIKRTIKRNFDALMGGENISNLRFFHQTLNSFTGLYALSGIKDGSIDELNQEEIIHGCDIVNLCLNDSPNASGATKSFTRGEFSLQEFNQYRNDLLENLKAEKIYIHPKYQMDRVIGTDDQLPTECAKEVLKLTR